MYWFVKSVQLALFVYNHCKVFSGEFMKTYGIRNVGSISKALKRLVADEIIYEFDGEYLFENPFFREWVRRR